MDTKNKQQPYLPIFSDYFRTVLNKISALLFPNFEIDWKGKVSRKAAIDMFSQFIGKIIRELLIRIHANTGLRITEVHYVETSNSEYTLEIKVANKWEEPIPPKNWED